MTDDLQQGFLHRLRRRKVVQWGVVYVAAAWGFLQGLEYISESFHWPEQLRQIALLALLIGLPIVLVLAWYHGDRGQQRITTPEFAILTLLLLLGGGAFWYYQRSSEAGRAAAPAATTAKPDTSPAAKDARPSVAVLPFENRSRLEDDAYFVDGIHDDILTQLSKVSALKVISRTSVERFRDTDLSLEQVAAQLGVTTILEGGVQRAGDRVRINVQLIDAASDAHLWAESYDRELTASNIFAMQTELALAIARALSATLTAGEKARVNAVPTQNLAAWEAYQLGKHHMAKRTSGGLAEAERFFQKAIDRDSRFALAYVGLADTTHLLVDYGGRSRDPSYARAEVLIQRALALDPDLSEARTTSATLADGRSDYRRAETEFRRAIALNPNYATAHHWYSLLLQTLGRRDEARRQIQIARELDPISVIILSTSAETLASLGHFDEALAECREIIAIDPMSPHSYFEIADLYAFEFGRLDVAIASIEKVASLDPGNPEPATSLAALYLQLGDEVRAGRWLELALERGAQYEFTQDVAAVFDLYRGDPGAFLMHAQAARSVRLLGAADMRKGDYASARERYAGEFPDLLAADSPDINGQSVFAALDLALALQHTGEEKRAKVLLDRTEAYIRSMRRTGEFGYGVADVAIHALRGDRAEALAKLREAQEAGWVGTTGWRRWPGWQGWRYHRDFDPKLASIRHEPEFKAVFADIERDMAQQRARLAARPKDAPLELTDASR